MSMNGGEDDQRSYVETGQGGATLSTGAERNGKSTKSMENGEQLLPGIPNDITLDLITPKLSWQDFHLLSSINRTWHCAFRGGQVRDARVRSKSAETFVVISHIVYTQAEDIYAICLYSMRENRTFKLPPIPDLIMGLPYGCQCVSLDGKIYILGGTHEPRGKLGRTEVYVLDLAGGRTQWTQCASMHEPRLGLGCGLCDGKIYAFGGLSLDRATCASEVYDPKVDAWSLIKPRPSLRVFNHVETVGRELFVFGGQQWEELNCEVDMPFCVNPLLSLEVYNPDMDQWRFIQYWGGRFKGVFVAHGKIYSTRRDGIYVYKTDENSWTLSQSSSFELIRHEAHFRFYHRVAVAADDEILMGGYYFNTDVPRVAVPRRGSWLLQSRGFGSEKKDVIWEKANCPLPHCLLSTIQL